MVITFNELSTVMRNFASCLVIFAFKVINMVLRVFAESKLCVVSILKGYSSQKHILDLSYESTALLKMKKYFKNNVTDPMLGFRKRFFFCSVLKMCCMDSEVTKSKAGMKQLFINALFVMCTCEGLSNFLVITN